MDILWLNWEDLWTMGIFLFICLFVTAKLYFPEICRYGRSFPIFAPIFFLPSSNFSAQFYGGWYICGPSSSFLAILSKQIKLRNYCPVRLLPTRHICVFVILCGWEYVKNFSRIFSHFRNKSTYSLCFQ